MLLSVKPGLTGYWKAYAQNNAGHEDYCRQDMELFYVANTGFLMDLKIILAERMKVIEKKC